MMHNQKAQAWRVAGFVVAELKLTHNVLVWDNNKYHGYTAIGREWPTIIIDHERAIIDIVAPDDKAIIQMTNQDGICHDLWLQDALDMGWDGLMEWVRNNL